VETENNIMYKLYGHEARKREEENREVKETGEETQETSDTGTGNNTYPWHPKTKIICPKCKGNRIKPATMTGIAGYGSPDQRYFCEDCGYTGSLILDVSEQEKSEPDIAIENDLMEIKRELESEEQGRDYKDPQQFEYEGFKKKESSADKIKKMAEGGGIIALLIFVLTKIGKLGFLLQLFKLKTLFTMFIAIGAYALIFGLPFAVGFVFAILVHETGHWVALRHYGVNVSSPIFVPFLGAAVFAKEMPKRVYHEAITAAAGPAFGFLITALFFVIGIAYNSGLFLAIAYLSGFINLFNLIPFGFLDGGRIAKALSKKMWIIGAVMLIALFVAMPNPFFLVILILLGLGYFAEKDQQISKDYHEIEFNERLIIGGVYILLLGTLGLLTVLSYEYLQIVHPLD